jgi:hypothetical protein
MENFIFTDYIEDLSLCDDIIKYHNETDIKSAGQIGKGLLVPDRKTSTDSRLSDNQELTIRYFDQVKVIMEKYIKKYPFCDYYNPWDVSIPVNIQHYKPGEGFHAWHSERISGNPDLANRHMVFMTYLNDVTDGGETEFFHQEMKIQPRKGLTVIWPADWTHTHRGVTSPTQEKYIVTGWYVYTA